MGKLPCHGRRRALARCEGLLPSRILRCSAWRRPASMRVCYAGKRSLEEKNAGAEFWHGVCRPLRRSMLRASSRVRYQRRKLEAPQRRWCRRATAARRSLRIGEGRIANADQQIRAEPYNAARIAQHPTLFFGPRHPATTRWFLPERAARFGSSGRTTADPFESHTAWVLSLSPRPGWR
jgi:hypothetical protein